MDIETQHRVVDIIVLIGYDIKTQAYIYLHGKHNIICIWARNIKHTHTSNQHVMDISVIDIIIDQTYIYSITKIGTIICVGTIIEIVLDIKATCTWIRNSNINTTLLRNIFCANTRNSNINTLSISYCYYNSNIFIQLCLCYLNNSYLNIS